jgi:cytokinin dehydrogenase
MKDTAEPVGHQRSDVATAGGTLEQSPATNGHSPLKIDRSPQAVAEASRDFGHLITGRAEGVVTVTSPAELLATVQHANDAGLTLTPCGARASCGGQSLPNGGLSLDLTHMTTVGEVNLRDLTITCDAGASLRSVSTATLAHGLLPNILSFNLDLTIGGVLSAGGFGANCHRFGPVIANVKSLEVVTGAGQHVHCSPQQESALFDAVLGGIGRCGVIARATLALRPIKKRVRIWTLLYHRHQDWLADQEAIARSQRFDYMQGFFWAGPQLLRSHATGFTPQGQWFHGLSIGTEYDDTAPTEGAMLAGLKPAGVLAIDDADTAQYIDLYRDRFVQMRRTQAWQRRHPWVDCILSPGILRDILPQILEKLPRAAGDGHRLAWFPTHQLPGLFSVPSGDWAVAFAVLPTSIEDSVYEETLAALDELRRMLWKNGGKAYLIGWFGPMDEAGWRRHYGARYDTWLAAKAKYDPRRVLHSMAFGS